VGALIAVLVLSGAIRLGPAQAAGPWRAQVVDAETGQPLEGVVVLAYWLKRYSTLGGWAGAEYYASEEVVTDAEGRFVIQARSTFTFNPFAEIGDAEFLMFKPGYGQWRFQGEKDWPRDAYSAHERQALVTEAWERFTGAGAVIELPPLKTRKERLEFLGRVSWAPVLPLEATKKMEKLIDQERTYHGLRKMYEGKP